MKHRPADLVAEIRAERGPWSLSGGRLRPPGEEPRSSFGVSICFGGSAFWSEIGLDWRPASEARRAARILKGSGYEILSSRGKPFHARRPLHSLRELDAEVKRLSLLGHDREALHSFPARAARRPGLPSQVGPLPRPAFDRLLLTHRWHLSWVGAERRGRPSFIEAPWTAAAWCLFIDDEDWIDFSLQIFSKRAHADERELRAFSTAFQRRLRPLRYRSQIVQQPDGSTFAYFSGPKAIRTPSAARRERARLDRLIFDARTPL